jgi:hypothetical protein
MAPSITETEPIAQIPVTKKVEDVKSQPVIDKHEEHQYLDLIREILETGEHRPDRYRSLSIYHGSLLTVAKNWHRNTISLRLTSSQIRTLLPNRNAHPPPHHKTRLPPRRDRRTPLVYLGLYLLPPPHSRWHKNLGWKWIPRIP